MLTLKLSIRNLFRNTRRTLITLSMMAGGFCAIVLFKGFSSYVIHKLENVVVRTQYGHFQIATPAVWDSSLGGTIEEKWLPPGALALEELKKRPEVESVSRRTQFYGLITSPNHTVSASGIALDFASQESLKDAYRCIEGKPLGSESAFEVMVGEGLAHHLHVHPGDSVTVVAQTASGAMNAVDFEVGCIFRTSMQEFDEVTFVMSQTLASRLLDTDLAQKWVVILKSGNDEKDFASHLSAWTPNQSPPLQFKSWRELATFYNQVKGFYDSQNGFLSFIIIAIVFLGIMNTLGMSVMERVSEIGTLRALGDRPREIVIQFVTEGVVLSAIGSFAGCLLSAALIWTINRLHLPLVLPNANGPMDLQIEWVPVAFASSFALLMVTSILASFLPARRASRMPIVEALR